MNIFDTLVSFETAKLAKEKGFNIPVVNYYTSINKYNRKNYLSHSEGYQTERLEESNWNDGKGSYPTKPEDVECSAPTQSLLQKWLREKHNIHIEVWKMSGHFRARRFEEVIEKINFDGNVKDVIRHYKYSNYLDGETYEEALEIGLQEGLKLI